MSYPRLAAATTTADAATATADAGPLLLDAKRLAVLLSVGLRTIRSWDSSGRLPTPLRIAGVVRWSKVEIEAWIRAGSPSRIEWAALRAARN